MSEGRNSLEQRLDRDLASAYVLCPCCWQRCPNYGRGDEDEEELNEEDNAE